MRDRRRRRRLVEENVDEKICCRTKNRESRRVVPDQRPLNGCVRVCVFTFTRLLACAVARGVPAERGDGSRGRLVRVADRRSQVRVRGVRRRVLSAAAGALHVDERLRQPRRRDLERAAHPRQK